MKAESSHATLMPSAQHWAHHVNPAFMKLLGTFGYGRAFVRAKGTRIWDHAGREYLDFLAGFGSVNLGHNPPRLIEAMHRFLDEEAMNLVHIGPQVHAGDFAGALCRHTDPLDMVLLANSGAEAVEAALKLARAATHRAHFIYCKGAFHGLNLGSLSVMGTDRLREPFEPLLEHCTAVPFGDVGALERALKNNPVAAFLVEPIQIEAGVLIPLNGYLAEACNLCRRHGALFILDEVQTGMGRTGELFAYLREGFTPDVLVLGKALGGSMVPISAALCTREMHQRAFGSTDTYDLHGSTFSGNALACRTAQTTLDLLLEENLSDAAHLKGERLLNGLRMALMGHPFVRDIRGRGLLVGIELGATETGFSSRCAPTLVDGLSRKMFGQWLALCLLEQGILAQPATQAWNILRLEPPLTVDDKEIDRIVSTLTDILQNYRTLTPLLRDVGVRLGRQAFSGFSF